MATALPALDSRVDQLLREYIRDLQAPSPDEVRRLVYEIELRKSKVEQQNEELRKIQQRLEAYKDRYVDLYDFAPLGYVTLDGDGYLQEINLAGAKLLGAERAALTGYAFGECVAKDDRIAFLDHVKECVRERHEVTSELRLLAVGGQAITVQLRSIPIEGPQDETLCKTAITDITERKDMEEAIRQSRAFLQTVIDAIPDTMLVIGRDYRVLLANCAAREMVGGIAPTVCLTCHQLSHHRDTPCEGQDEPCPLCQVIATKAPMTVIHTHYDAKGSEVFVEVNAAPVFDDAGEVVHIIEVCRDITKRTQAEQSLEQERNLLRTLIDNLPDSIYVKDAQSRFIAANLTTARIMGAVTPADLLGKTDGDFYPRELAAEYHADEEQLLQSGRPLVNKAESRRDATGESRTVLTTKIPLKDSRGQVFGLVGISRDTTEHKHAEEALHLVQQQLLAQQDRQREQAEAETVKSSDQLAPEKQLASMTEDLGAANA
jgi:PAS domain S-box-containing protein